MNLVPVGGERWAVVASSDSQLRVNGLPVDALGMRILTHKDEVSLKSLGSVFFSAEKPAEVVPFPGAGRTIFCGRCRQEIKPGSSAVRCPGCGVWHDQSEELTCWRYSETCSCCPHPTIVEAGFAWTPEE